MNIEQLKKHLKDRLVASIDDTLKQLLIAFEKNDDLYDEIILLSAEHAELVRKERTRVESLDDIRLNMNSLRSRILALIKLLDDPETKRYNFSFSRFEKILVLSPHENRKKAMMELFPENHWKNVIFTTTDKLPLASTIKECEVIVFDNHDSSDVDQTPVWEQLLKNTTKYVLYYGGHSPVVSSNPSRIYSANSIFSFHGRLQELLNFVREFPATEKQSHEC